MGGIGPNTNAPAELIASDCLLLIGEDAASTEPLLADCFGLVREQHAFRGYVFQRRGHLTTIFSGMGTACLEPLVWELGLSNNVRRLVLAGTAGLLESGRPQVGQAYAITQAKAMGTGIDAIGLDQAFIPRWPIPPGTPFASAVSTDFYYGFSKSILAARHPLASTKLQALYRSAAREDLVDMEVAQFYALCLLILPPDCSFIAVKSPSNPAGIGAQHLANAPSALAAAVGLAARLLGKVGAVGSVGSIAAHR